MPATSKGLCKYCGQEFAKSEMGDHLNACQDRKAAMEPKKGEKTCEYVQLLVSGTYLPEYWLIVDARVDASLGDLDQFLRDIWLDFCWYVSEFKIAHVRYSSAPDAPRPLFRRRPKSMDVTLKEALEGIGKASYVFDPRWPTSLTIEVQGWHSGKRMKEPVTILSRNIPPEIKCSECGKPAEWIHCDAMRGRQGHVLFCSDCLRKAAYEQEALDDEYDEDDEYDDEEWIFDEYLPICNSPRVGVCTYEGSQKYPEVFVPDTQSSQKKNAQGKAF